MFWNMIPVLERDDIHMINSWRLTISEAPIFSPFFTYTRHQSSIILSFQKQMSRSMEGPQLFEGLPSELKMKILQSCDYRSLRDLVHASPVFHSFYLSNREELLALVTVRQIADRGFNFLGKYNVIEAAGAYGPIHDAATELYDQCQRYLSTNGKHVIRLGVQSSLALLKIEHAIGWRLERVEGRTQVKIKRETLFERIQRRDGLHYQTLLLDPQEGPAWSGTYSDEMFKMMIRKYHESKVDT